MKRIIILALSLIVCAGLFAQDFTPYGSVRVGYWFDMQDEDYYKGTDKDGEPMSRTFSSLDLQNNSRIGFNYKKGDLTAKAEIGANGSFRYLWGKHDFGGFSLLAGLNDDGFDKRANQVWGEDKMLQGYGAVYSGRNTQVKFEMENGFYAAILKPYTDKDPITGAFTAAELAALEAAGINISDGVDHMIPRINLGYNVDLNDIKIYPTFSFQMYNYNKDILDIDSSVMSWLFGATVDYKMDALSLRGHFHFGSNVANMYKDMGVGAGFDLEKEETIDETTMGGFLAVGFDVSDVINVGGGFGFASTSKEDYDNDTKMAFYLQSTLKIGDNFNLIPEFGMHMDGDKPQHKDYAGDAVARGSLMYVGAQLRYNF